MSDLDKLKELFGQLSAEGRGSFVLWAMQAISPEPQPAPVPVNGQLRCDSCEHLHDAEDVGWDGWEEACRWCARGGDCPQDDAEALEVAEALERYVAERPQDHEVAK